MNEHELSRGLQALHQERADVVDVEAMRQQVLAIPIQEMPQRRFGLPSIDAGRFTMFSALKFVAASVIVALFGGFLLTGVLTTQQGDEVLPAAVKESPSPSKTEGLLSGVALDLEEVETGVFRVVDDGIRDLANANNDDIVAGPDGSVWLLRSERFFRLGSDEWHEWPPSRSWDRDFEVAPDGTVWMHAGTEIESFDGEEWTTRQPTDGVASFEIAPDGTVWATWLSLSGVEILGRLDGDGRQILDSPGDGLIPIGRGILSLLPVTDPDDIWATFDDGIGPPEVVRAVDGVWRRLVDVEGSRATWRGFDEQVLGEGPEVFSRLTDIGPDGTVWGVGTFLDAAADSMDDDLYRVDGGKWSRWSLLDIGFGPGQADAQFRVAPDGSVWFGVRTGPLGGPEESCDGVAHFDGQAWDRHLAGLCVRAIDSTTDGVVWLLARNPDADVRYVYVIDPEAAGATEAEVSDPPTVEVANDTTETRPTTTEELLSGMVTEEVEPDVYRVVDDGVRDLPLTLDADGDPFAPTEAIRVSPDGGLWVFGGHWGDVVFRLGEPGGYPWPEGTPLDLLDLVGRADDVEVAPDGTVWMADTGTASVYSLDGTGWTTWPLPHSQDLNIEVLADGTVWAGPTLRLGDGGWETVESPGCTLYQMQASDTDIYVDGGPGGSTDCDGTLYRFDGTDWQEVDTPDGYLSRGGFYGASPVGADGTLWVDYRRGPEAELGEGNGRRGIARFDGSRWEEWDIHAFDEEEVTSKGHAFIDYFMFEVVAPDGSLWGSVDECDGIGHFDGTNVTRYLARHCIYSPDVAPDGSLWLVAAEGTSIYDPTGSPGLYVIRP